jgi:hypothetical protein
MFGFNLKIPLGAVISLPQGVCKEDKGDAFVAMCEWKGRMYIATSSGVYVVENNQLRLLVTSKQLGTLKVGERKTFE